MNKSRGAGCSAVGCCLRPGTNLFSTIKLFYFPREKRRRKAWEIAVRRLNWTATRNSRLCSNHFITGQPSKYPDHPDYVPSLFTFNQYTPSAKSLAYFKESEKRQRVNQKVTNLSEPSENLGSPNSVSSMFNTDENSGSSQELDMSDQSATCVDQQSNITGLQDCVGQESDEFTGQQDYVDQQINQFMEQSGPVTPQDDQFRKQRNTYSPQIIVLNPCPSDDSEEVENKNGMKNASVVTDLRMSDIAELEALKKALSMKSQSAVVLNTIQKNNTFNVLKVTKINL